MPSIAPQLTRSPSLRHWFVEMSFILDHPLGTCDRVRLGAHLSSEMTESQLHPMLAHDDRPDPVGLLERAWGPAGNLVKLSLAETAFVERAQRADLDAALIFVDDAGAARRFTSPPQVMWKLQNLKKHLGLAG